MKTIPNLGLSIPNGLLLIFFISTIVTIYAYYNIQNSKNEKIIQIKNQENRLSYSKYFFLYVIRFIHYFLSIYVLLFLFIFTPKIFIYVISVIFVLFVFINLLYLQNECPISYLEKYILLDNKYIFNSVKDEQIFFILLYPNINNKDNKVFIQFSFTLSIIYFIIIYIRLYKHYFLPKSQIPEAIRFN